MPVTLEDIRQHISKKTFVSFLIQEIEVTPHAVPGEKHHTLELRFPSWFFEFVSLESQTEYMEFIRRNAHDIFAGDSAHACSK